MSHPDDELLSALLDGEAPPGDVAHAEGCDQCQARLAELRGVVTLVGTAVAMPPRHLREAAMAKALHTLDEPAPTAGPRRMNALSAAAVLLVALAVGGLLISQVGRAKNDRSNTSGTASLAQGLVSTTVSGRNTNKAAAADAADSTLAAPSSELAAGAGGVSPPPYEAGELGTITTIDDVIRRASADLAQPSDVQVAHAMTEPSPCPYLGGQGRSLWQATLTYNGEAAVAHALETDAGRVMQILRRADCSVLVRQGF